MKNLGSQISVALVCCILGFMLSYQFKTINKQDKEFNVSRQSSEITAEIEQLKKQKTELQDKVDELQEKVKTYEESTVGSNEVNKQLLEELNESRMLLGNVDVRGEGVILTIIPQEGLFDINEDSEPPIYDKDLAYIINYLNAAGAEAISINDIRITSRTGISTGGNLIKINEERISPYNKIVIRAIGNKENLEKALKFQGTIPELKKCDIKFEKSDDIVVKKYGKKYKFDYSKPVEKK